MNPQGGTREQREKQIVAVAACEALKALGSKAVVAAQELRTAVNDDKPAPSQLVRQTHDALLEGLMDRRVRSTQIERKKLFGIPLEPQVPSRSQMRDLVRRFELAFMRPTRAASHASPARG